MEKDSIDKINEQIESLLNEGKKEEKDDSHEVIIDRKYEYDEGDTKKIDSIDDIDEEVDSDATKKLDTIENIEEEPTVEEEEKEELEEPKKEENPKKDDDEDKKKKEKKTNLIIILSLAFVGLICILFILVFALPSKESSKKVSTTKKDTLTKSEQKKVIEGYGDALKGIIGVTYEKENKILEYDEAIKLIKYDYKVVCSEHEVYEDGLVYLNNCTINGKKTTYSYGEKQEKKEEPKISEDAIKVYVSKKGNKATLNAPKNLDGYDIYYFEIDGKYTGLEL